MDALGLLPSVLGARAYDSHGAGVGHVADMLFDERTQRPAWLLLRMRGTTDRFGLAPAGGLRHHPGGLELRVSLALVLAAPMSAGPPHELAVEQARALAGHYGVPATPGPWRGLVAPTLAWVDGRVPMAR